MLLETKKISETKYALRCAFEGTKYTNALLNYPTYIDRLFSDSYENDLFPKGRTPVVVNEEMHGDDLYRYVLKGNFKKLYQEAITTARLADGHLKGVEIEYFSSDRILFTLIVSTPEDPDNGDTQPDPMSVFEKSMDEITTVDKLKIFSKVTRDTQFWQNLQAYCMAYQQTLSKEVTPVLTKIGVLHSRGGGIGVDLSSDDPMRALYPLIEALFFPCGVINAVLRKYLDDFSKEDELNIDKYIFSTAFEMADIYAQAGCSKRVLLDRLQEYSRACKNELFSGYSLHGQFGMDFGGLESWSKNHQVKCAHLFCDHIAYIEHFGKLSTYEDLDKLRPIVISNTDRTLNLYMELFDKVYTTSGSIFMTVRGLINGSTRMQWKAEGVCQHCGSEFKRGLFGTKCTNCKVKKDY